MQFDQLILPAVGLAVGGLWIGGLVGLRTPVAPSGYWPIGWALLLNAAMLSALSGAHPELVAPSKALGVLFAPAMFAGALQHVGARVPRWCLPLALSIAVARGALFAAGLGGAADVLAIAAETGFLLAAAVVIDRGEPRWERRPLQAAFVLLAGIELADTLMGFGAAVATAPWILWCVAGVAIVAVQILATFERLRGQLARLRGDAAERAEYLQALVSSIDPARVVLFERDASVRSIFGGGGERFAAAPRSSGVHPLGIARTDHAERLASAVRAVARDGAVRVVQVDVGGADAQRAIELGLAPLRDRAGGVDGVLGVLTDVTDRERVASALRDSEQRMRELVHSLTGNNVVMIDRDGRIEEVVEHVDRGPSRYGLGLADVEGASIEAILPGASGDDIRRTIGAVFRDGRSCEFEREVALPSGTFTFHIAMRPLRAADGSIPRVLAVVQDVTERVRADERKERLEARMLQSQKLESLGVLAGGIAHDFNNLLTGILGNADLALSQVAPSDPVHPMLRDIERATVRAAELTAQLLAYAGKADVETTTLELGALVEETIPLLHTSVGPATRLATRASERPAWIRGDATRVRQLLMNLVTNAVEALPPAGGNVEIETGVLRADRETLARASHADELPEGDYAFLRVRDDGCGMDETTLQRIFDPFFTTKFEGRGLGLASALGIVRSHGGALTVESEPGRGTEFRVLFPNASPPVGAEVVVRDAPAAGVVAGTIVVVDDEPAVLAVARQMLEQQGYRVIACADAAQALAATARVDDLTAAVVDLTMPDTSGEKLCLQLRELRRDLPVLFVSGRGTQSALERVGGIPRSAFVAKPFRSAALRDALAALVE
ncbi:MAG: PAS domain-containing protein [Myxococcales bacterium]|nr:PAS domain-containing protein [Myxococcales bacterium]